MVESGPVPGHRRLLVPVSEVLQVLRPSFVNCYPETCLLPGKSFLFPLLLARRTADRILGRQGSDVGFLPAPLEWFFRHVMLLEAALIRRGVSLPIGASAIALARSPGG